MNCVNTDGDKACAVNHSQYLLPSLHILSSRISPAMLLRYSPTPLSLVATPSSVSFSRSPSFQLSPHSPSISQPIIRVLSSSALRRGKVACCAAMEDSTNSSATLESPHKLRLLFVEMGTGYDQHGFVSCPRNCDYRVQCICKFLIIGIVSAFPVYALQLRVNIQNCYQMNKISAAA